MVNLVQIGRLIAIHFQLRCNFIFGQIIASPSSLSGELKTLTVQWGMEAGGVPGVNPTGAPVRFNLTGLAAEQPYLILAESVSSRGEDFGSDLGGSVGKRAGLSSERNETLGPWSTAAPGWQAWHVVGLTAIGLFGAVLIAVGLCTVYKYVA